MRDPLFVLVMIIFWLLLCAVVGGIASSFRRPAGLWFLLALVLSPLIALVLLFVVGDPQRAVALREKEERIRQRHPERKDIREAALNKMNCPRCGAVVNPVTGDGLHSSDAEPWLLICNQCQGKIEPNV